MDLQAGGLRGLQQARDTGWESCTQTAPRSSQACHHPFPQPAHPNLFSGLLPVPGTQWAPSGDDLEVEGPEFGLPCHAEGRNYPIHLGGFEPGNGPGTLSAPLARGRKERVAYAQYLAWASGRRLSRAPASGREVG